MCVCVKLRLLWYRTKLHHSYLRMCQWRHLLLAGRHRLGLTLEAWRCLGFKLLHLDDQWFEWGLGGQCGGACSLLHAWVSTKHAHTHTHTHALYCRTLVALFAQYWLFSASDAMCVCVCVCV